MPLLFIRRALLLGSLLLGLVGPIWAQVDSVRLDNAFNFADGLYTSLYTLVHHQPAANWASVQGKMVEISDDYRVQIEGFGVPTLATDSVFAVVIDGLPYLPVRRDTLRNFMEFAGLRNLGRYAYLSYDTLVTSSVNIRAYNPVTGRPFRSAYLPRTERQPMHRVFDFATGLRHPCTPDTVARLVSRDQELARAVARIEHSEDVLDRLYTCLLRYNERYPFRVVRRP